MQENICLFSCYLLKMQVITIKILVNGDSLDSYRERAFGSSSIIRLMRNIQKTIFLPPNSLVSTN